MTTRSAILDNRPVPPSLTRCVVPLVVTVSALACFDGRLLAQPATTPPAPSVPASSPYRLLKSISGSKGEIKGGRYVVLDPRTAFRVPEDTTVVVYFEWLGPAGKHQLAGTWRGPSNTSTTSSFEYVAKESAFSAFWELTLPASAPRGAWALEATIDGFPAGQPVRATGEGVTMWIFALDM